MHLFAASVLGWMHRLGGPGLILLAQVDNSFIPVPGSVDALTIVLAASKKDLWWYYALMATVGALIGGYLMYRLGARGGRQTIEKRVGKQRAEKVYSAFERHGFWAVFVGALAPPPMPAVAFTLSAGALQYPKRKFLIALGSARAIRYTTLAYLASVYGKHIGRWMYRYYQPLLIVLIAAGVIGGVLTFYYWRKHKHRAAPEKTQMAA